LWDAIIDGWQSDIDDLRDRFEKRIEDIENKLDDIS